MAAGRALPVARNTVMPLSMAARMAATEEGSTRLELSSSVPSCRGAAARLVGMWVQQAGQANDQARTDQGMIELPAIQ
jgi:hypothetical protein